MASERKLQISHIHRFRRTVLSHLFYYVRVRSGTVTTGRFDPAVNPKLTWRFWSNSLIKEKKEQVNVSVRRGENPVSVTSCLACTAERLHGPTERFLTKGQWPVETRERTPTPVWQSLSPRREAGGPGKVLQDGGTTSPTNLSGLQLTTILIAVWSVRCKEMVKMSVSESVFAKAQNILSTTQR